MTIRSRVLSKVAQCTEFLLKYLIQLISVGNIVRTADMLFFTSSRKVLSGVIRKILATSRTVIPSANNSAARSQYVLGPIDRGKR